VAEIVLGIGTSHGPQLGIPGDKWFALLEKDKNDKRMNYEALLAKAPASLAKEITEEKFVERWESCQRDLDTLSEVLREARPDVLVVFGDDQHEQFDDGNEPVFCIFHGEEMPVVSRRAGGASWNQYRQEGGSPETAYVGHAGLGTYLVETLTEEGFDVARSNKLREGVGLGHAFTVPFNRLLPGAQIPMVPVMINTFFPPNQPTPKRCFALGQAVRQAIEAWDTNQRVAIIGSGGLSHVIIDEEIDHATIDALKKQDAAALCALPVDKLNLGTSEIRNWIALAGAVEPLNPHIVDYVPCYRSPAGTGCAMGFAYWD
jgi:hypothetical protein